MMPTYFQLKFIKTLRHQVVASKLISNIINSFLQQGCLRRAESSTVTKHQTTFTGGKLWTGGRRLFPPKETKLSQARTTKTIWHLAASTLLILILNSLTFNSCYCLLFIKIVFLPYTIAVPINRLRFHCQFCYK